MMLIGRWPSEPKGLPVACGWIRPNGEAMPVICGCIWGTGGGADAKGMPVACGIIPCCCCPNGFGAAPVIIMLCRNGFAIMPVAWGWRKPVIWGCCIGAKPVICGWRNGLPVICGICGMRPVG